MKLPILCLAFVFASFFRPIAQGMSPLSLDKLQPAESFDNIHVTKLYSDKYATGFVIWVKKDVRLHQHNFHSETVYVISGKGQMRLGDKTFQISKGDAIFIPAGTPHAVKVKKGVLKAFSVQAPEFDGSDRVFLD